MIYWLIAFVFFICLLAMCILVLPPVRYAIRFLRNIKPAGRLIGADALPENGKALFVAATPGEVEFACGGTIPKLLERGNSVYLALLTDGKRPMIPLKYLRERTVEKHRSQQRKAAMVAGFADVLFYGFPKDSLKGNEKAVAMISTLMRELKPTSVFAYDPEAPSLRKDPPAAGAIAGLAAARSGSEASVFYYMTHRPNVIIDVSDTFEAKLRLLSHFDKSFVWRLGFGTVLSKIGSRYGTVLGIEHGEGYLRSSRSVA